MNIFFILSLTILLINEIYSESLFEKRFKILHREPPPPKSIGRANIQTELIEQKLDNFDEKNEETWKMRYMVNLEHFKPQSPIFIFVGGEWSISPGFISGGNFFDIGKELNAAFYYPEHRYYGKSSPTTDYTTKNLKYLSVKQSLADLAHFIKTIKLNTDKKDSKVVLAGGSYSATMVAWFKKEYPELAVGAWSSSAPLFAKVDFKEYKEVAGRSIITVGGQKCYDRIKNGIHTLEEMFENKKIAEIKALLKICDNFDNTNKMDVSNLFSSISDIFAGLVQSHVKGNIEQACEQILKSEDDLAGVSKWFLSRIGESNECNDFTYLESIKTLSETEVSESMFRQWTYQTCSEFGWYQTSTSLEQPFGTKFSVDFYEKLCEDVFGIENATLYNNVEETNRYWGGLKPNVKNVYFTHGELDPWSAMGLQKNDDHEDNVIPLYAHCQDFASISEADTNEMKASKLKLKNLIKKWLDIDEKTNFLGFLLQKQEV